MDKVALASINTFGISPKADFVPSSEQLITLTYGQLQDLIERAIQPLQDRIESLEVTVASQEERISALERDNTSLQADLKRFKVFTRTGQVEDILEDLEGIDARIRSLESHRTKVQPLQKDRSDVLRALLAANGGKMLAIDARKKMHLPKNRFSELLKTCDFIEIKPMHTDKRKEVIILKSELVPRN